MKFDLKAGNLIEILTPAEHAEQIDRVVKMLAKTQRPPNSFHPTGEATANASGTISTIQLYRVPNGMIGVAHRINVEAKNYTRSSPLLQGEIRFGINSTGGHDVFVGLPATPNGATAPASIVDSVSAGQIAKQGDWIVVSATGLPANQILEFRLQVLLWETEG